MTSVRPQVIELLGILWRDNETELVSVLPAARVEGFHVGLVAQRAVGLAGIALATHTVALDVAQVTEG
ncbi:hypothetical protein D3C78_1844690 [compost metagenome]